MVVRQDVNEPTQHGIDDPKAGVKKEDKAGQTAEYWEEKAKSARAKREYEEETRRADGIGKESPDGFKVKGSVNIGDFNLQEQQKELQESINGIQQEAKERIAALQEKNENYRDQVNQIQMKMMQEQTRLQVESLQKLIEQKQFSKTEEKTLASQIEDIKSIAGVLGMHPPAPNSGTPPDIQLQMLKMELEAKERAQKFELDKIESDRNWQLALKRLESDQQSTAAQVQIEREKRDRFANPMAAIGAAIAQGLLDSGNGGSGKGSTHIKQQPQSQPKGKTFKMQAIEGDSGEAPCPDCDKPVAITPDGHSAVCAYCNAKIIIERIPASEAESPNDV